ncbi:MAG: ArnT family glycosyltransferase [Phycisphaerae bacterium]
MSAPEPTQGTLPRGLVIALAALGVLGGLVVAVGELSPVVMVAFITGVTGVFAAGLAALCGGGFVWPVIRRLAPQDAPAGLLVTTAAALGLWLLSTLVLVVGSAVPGSLHQFVWGPIVLAGIVLAAWFSRERMNALRMPKNFDGRALMWVVIAVAGGFWLAGAALPPGLIRTPDTYDVLEYHLQVPREFYASGGIGELQHNCYSYYPLGAHMLFLLQMCLHGGAYAGMYAAKATHGLFALIAVIAVYTTLKSDEEARGRFSAVLLATVPFVLYLSWLAMVELAQLCYLVLALLWLRHWLRRYDTASAVLVGASLGAACAVKYLSVGLIAAPVLAMMLIFAARSGQRLRQFALACLAALVLFSPWLIRNTCYTDNPVFPLMTRTFGRGHWSEQSEQRWVAGHGPEKQPPVPRPEGWEMPRTPSRLLLLYNNFLRDGRYALPVLLLGGAGFCVLIAKTGPLDKWGCSLVGVGVGQLVVWSTFTHEMPGRFLVPIVAPLCLLGGDALGYLSRVKVNPLTHQARPSPKGPWGLPVAAVVLLAAGVVNLASTYNVYRVASGGFPAHGIAGEGLLEEFTRDTAMGPEHRALLVGDAAVFYRPIDTIYATVFDADQLVATVEGGVDDLADRGVTHVLFNWAEISRLSRTYGYPAPVGPAVYQWGGGEQPPRLELLDRLKAQGLRLHEHYYAQERPGATRTAETQPTTLPARKRLMASLYLLPGVEPLEHEQTGSTTAPAE